MKNKVVVKNDQGPVLEAVTWNAADLKDFPLQIEMKEKGNTVRMRFTQVQLRETRRQAIRGAGQLRPDEMRIINLNPDTAIGATAWFVEMEGHRLLMDAGTHPRLEGRAGLPRYDLVKKEEVDAIAISHCHHDHVGSLPVALRYFPQAHVLMTELSYFLAERVLHNSVNVMKRQRDELGLKEYPLYSHDEVDELAPRIPGLQIQPRGGLGLLSQDPRRLPLAHAGIL